MEMCKYVMEVNTKAQNMDRVMSFVELCVRDIGSRRASHQLTVVGEEIAFNIFSYAYDSMMPGVFTLSICLHPEQHKVTMEFRDKGKRYNPLESQMPDFSEHISKREIGGLGIAIFKMFTDKQVYKYEDGHNILVVEKHIDGLENHNGEVLS